MNALLQDLRFGLRMLRRTPAVSALAIVTIALGVGVNIAIFSVVDAIALRQIGVAQPDRIVRILNYDASHRDRGVRSSWIEFERFRTETGAFTAIAAAERRGVIVRENGEARLLLANVVSDTYFDVMQVTPSAGRTFLPADFGTPGASPLVLISYDYWQRQFQGDPQIAGRTIVASDVACVVLGVLPRSFRGSELFLNPDVYVPLSTWLMMVPGDRVRLQRPQSRNLELFGRLQPGIDVGQAGAALTIAQRRLAAEYPEQETGRRIDVKLDRKARSGQVGSISALLAAVAGLVLLIACANIVNLLLVRGDMRRAEFATRVALGASRARTVRQLATETLLLTAAGGAGAVLLAAWVIGVLPSLMPAMPFSVGFDFRLDGRALAFGAGVSIVCALVTGVLPALAASGIAPAGTLKEATGGGRGRWRDAMVVGQVALTVLLLVAAGLVGRTLMAIRTMDPGFDTRAEVILATMSTRGLTLPQEHAYDRTLLERLSAIPGVQSTAVASRIPLWSSGGGAALQAWVPGLPESDRDGRRVGFAVVSPGYFSTLGTHVVRGRAIGAQDDEQAPGVAVVNQVAAELLWPGQDALGKRFRVNGATGREVEVVGVAQDGRYRELTETPLPYMFLPLFQEAQILGSRWGGEIVAIRTSAPAASQAQILRRAIADINPGVLVLSTITMDDHMRASEYANRLIVQLVGSMGVLGLVLAAIGLFGVISYAVTRRTREIGVRIALGANPQDVLRLVFARALLLAGIGIATGVALALASGPLLSSVLYGVGPRDPTTIAASVLAMAVVALGAAALPARRAVAVDPIVTLRAE